MTMKSLGKITNPKVSLFYEDTTPFLALEFDADVTNSKGSKDKANIKIHKIYLNNISINTETKEERQSYTSYISPILPPPKIITNRKISFDLGFNANKEVCTITTDENLKKLPDRQKLIGREVVVIENHENGGVKSNNIKYISKAYDKKIKLVYNVAEEKECDIFITDFFLSEFKDLNNDYIYNGYLKVTRDDFRFIE